MLVLINGLPLFAEKLANDLNSMDSRNKYVFVNTYYSKWQQLKFLLLLPFSKLVISFNGVSDNSGSLNWVLRLKKKMIMQWQGTDVSLAVERNSNGTIDKKYINYAKHFTDASWLKEELIGICNSVELVCFKHLNFIQNESKFQKISVLSYMGNRREDFYGYNEVRNAAIHFKTIDFHIVGSNGKGLEIPENVIFHGWVNQAEVSKLMKSTPIFLRLTKHDGNSLSVVEALGNGCEVIWSYPSEKTYLAKNSDELIHVLEQLFDKVENNGMKPNVLNFEYVNDNYQKEKVIGNYIKEINKFLDEK